MSGYEHGLRKQLLPIQGQDGYVWIMYAQQMLHDGTPRIRYTMFDNAPLEERSIGHNCSSGG